MRSWHDLPIGRVAQVQGAQTEAIELSLEPLPADAPAVVSYYPAAGSTATELVSAILSELERVAVGLFPAWLPDAARIEGPEGAGLAAVRSVASETASRTTHFGPFLVALAERALLRSNNELIRFAPEVRAAELAKVLAVSYGRPDAAILVDIPRDQASLPALVTACEWLAARAGFGVWLAGAPDPVSPDHVRTVAFQLPPDVAEIVDEVGMDPVERPRNGSVISPPLMGLPKWNSTAEQLLEAALAGVDWAHGRRWNRGVAGLPGYIIDLTWRAERLAVEIDGDEHRGRLHFEKDRRRDVHLQLAGYAVFRFTNVRVLGDVDGVLADIRKFIESKRG